MAPNNIQPPDNTAEIASILIHAINQAMTPLIDKLESKIERLEISHRLDYEKLRTEFMTNFVALNVLEPQLDTLKNEQQRLERDRIKEDDRLHAQIKEGHQRPWNVIVACITVLGALVMLATFFLQHPIH